MDRRSAIKALSALPFFTIKLPKEQEALAVKIHEGCILAFMDPNAFDFESLEALESTGPNDPLNHTIFFPVHLRPGQKVEDVVAFYDLKKGDAGN